MSYYGKNWPMWKVRRYQRLGLPLPERIRELEGPRPIRPPSQPVAEHAGYPLCPYCGRPLKKHAPTCSYHDDLPELESWK